MRHRKTTISALVACIAGSMASCTQQEIRRTDRGYRIPTYRDTTPSGSPSGGSSQNKSSQNKSEGSGVDPVKTSSSGSSQNKP